MSAPANIDALVEAVVTSRLTALLVEAREAVRALPPGDRRARTLATAVAHLELANAPAAPARRPPRRAAATRQAA